MYRDPSCVSSTPEQRKCKVVFYFVVSQTNGTTYSLFHIHFTYGDDMDLWIHSSLERGPLEYVPNEGDNYRMVILSDKSVLVCRS